jgi:hypothetical protein
MSNGNTNNTVFIQKLFTSRDNFVDGNIQQATANAANYVGQEGRIWWNPDLNGLYYSDGNTPGGFLINGPVGNGQPGGPVNSVQINNGDGNFYGSANFIFEGSNVNVAGNVNASYFIGNGSQLTDIDTTKIFNGTSYANIETPNGNLEVNINTNSWVFDDTGNLTLPGNSEISINYANGYPYGVTNIAGLAAGNTTEVQFNTNGNFAASGNLRFDTGSNTLYTDQIEIPTGTVLSGVGEVVYVIATLTLNQILANSDGTLAALPANSYGNPNEVPAPWAVFQFTTDPSPALEVNDILSGTGVPVPSSVTYVGTGGNSNIVVTTSTFYGLPTPLPTFGAPIPVSRQTLNAGLNISTQSNTDIVMTPGPGGGIIWAGNLVPLTNDEFTLGSPTRRIKQAYFGSNTVYIYDNYLGTDQTIGANNGNLIIGGGAGLTVGNFIMSGDTLYLINPAEEFNIGTPGATGNLNINRPMTVSDSTGNTRFSVKSDGRVQIDAGPQPANTPGAFNIVASNGGYYQNVTNSGGMIHVTGNDGNATRVNLDNFNNGNHSTSFNAIIGRGASGTAQTPTKTLSGDIFLRISTVGWKEETGFGGATVASQSLDLVALEDFYNASRGTAYRFYNAPLGSNSRSFSSQIDSTGLSFVQPADATYDANIGITFNDNTRQITAFNDTSAVTSVTVGVGLSQTTTVGDVGIDATGVTTVAGTANQVYVNANTSGGNSNAAITLTLPQNIDSGATLTFSNLTITGTLTAANFTSTGNSIIHDKILNLAYDSTSNAQIDGGGIILGNISDPYTVSILYDLNNNQWNTDGAGLYTLDLVAANANIDFLNVQNGGHFGLINEQLDYPNAYVQVDANVNSYSQIVSQNHSPGTQASSDLVLVNDIGDDGNHFIDLGINGSNYTDPAYSSTLANDGYLYMNQGNLVIGTDTAAKTIKFIAGGTTSNDIVLTISNTGLVTPGNAQANYFIGNGRYLTGLPAGNIVGQVANALVAGTVYTNAQPNITSVGTLTALTVSGNITSGNANLGNVATANFFVGNGYGLTNINVSNIVGTIANANYAAYAGNVTIAAQPNITSVGTLTGLVVSGNITSGNANLGNLALANYFSGNANALFNIQGANVTGQVSYAAVANSVAGANVSGTVANATYALSSGSVANSLTINNSGTGSASGVTFNGSSAVIISYNTVGAPKADGTGASGTWGISISGNANVANTANAVAGANVSGQVAYAAIANSVAGANVSGQVSNALIAGTVYTNAQPNITSVGTLTTLTVSGNANVGNLGTGRIIATGNISGTQLISNIATGTAPLVVTSTTQVANLNVATAGLATFATTANAVAGANVSGQVANALVAGTVYTNAQPNITSVGTLTSLTIGAGNATINPITLTSGSLQTSTSAGDFEYDGVTAYFTPSDAQRGVIPAIQIFIPNANVAYSNTTSLQPMFGLTNGVSVTANTKYMYRICGTIRKSSSSSAAMQYAMDVNNGATIQRHYYIVNPCPSTTQTAVTAATMMSNYLTSGFDTAVTVSGSLSFSAGYYNFIIDGEIEILTAGQINPQVGFTGTLGTSSYIEAGSSMQIWPVGNITGNTSVGNWS